MFSKSEIIFIIAEEKSSCEAVSRILDNNKKVRTSMFDLWGKERKDEEEKLMNLVLMNNKDKPTSRQKIIGEFTFRR